MKYLVFLLIVNFQLQASPSSTSALKNQNQKSMITRMIKEELSMNAEKIAIILKSNKIEFEHKNNIFNFIIEDFNLTIIYDLNADRMRIVCPIARLKDITNEQIKLAMEANFHTVLDAKYAISDDIMWAVFIHPLSDLSENLFQSALQQTLYAAATFGTEYTSGALSFPKTNQQKTEKEKDTIKENKK